MKSIFGRFFWVLVLLGLVALPGMAQLTIGAFNFPNATRTGTYGAFQMTASAPGGIIYTWQVEAASGQLPAGVTLSAGGVISASNVTATAGAYSFVLRATCSSGCVQTFTNTRAFSITVVDPPSFSAVVAALPAGINNVPYSQNVTSFFSASGGVSPYTFSVLSVAPAPDIGLGISSSPTLAGVPNAPPNTYNVSFGLRDSNGVFAASNVTLPILISSNASTFSPVQLPNWTITRPYLREIQAQGGVGAYTYQISGGLGSVGLQADAKLACPSEAVFEGSSLYSSPLSLTGGPSGPVIFSAVGLPFGFLVDPSTGLVSGGTEGTFNVRVLYSAQYSNGLKVGRTCNFVSASPSGASIASGCPLNYGVVGSPYFSAIPLTGYFNSPGFDIPANTLPAGLSLNTSTGSITGTPTQAGIYNFTAAWESLPSTGNNNCSIRVFNAPSAVQGGSFVYGVPSATGTVNLAVSLLNQNPAASANYAFTINALPTIAPFSYPSGVIGGSYSSSLLSSNLSGGTPTFSYTLAPGSSPLPPGLTLGSNGTISGVPTQNGSFSFSLQVTDIAGAVVTAARQIVVSSGLTISPGSLSSGVVGVSYSATFMGSGGLGSSYVFDLADSSLPAGLSLASNGALTGIPTQGGLFSFAVRLRDSAQNSVTTSYSLLVVTFTCPSSQVPVGASYSSGISLSGLQISGYALSAGSLPTGLVLNASSGVVSGTPVVEGISNPSFTATDVLNRTFTRSCPLVVSSPMILRSPRTTGRTSTSYVSSVSVSGGTAPYSFAINSGNLPAGLTMNAGTGLISGQPTAAGASEFRVQVSDAGGRLIQRTFTIWVLSRAGELNVRCPLPSAIRSAGYQSSASINSNLGLIFRSSAGLPSGLSLNSANGLLSGVPTAAGTYNFTLFASIPSNPIVDVVSASCTIQVEEGYAPLRLACNDQEDLVVGEAYASPAIATGGFNPVGIQLSQSNLPAGLVLNSATGLISGAATTAGSFSYALRAADNGDSSATASCAVRIAAAPPISITTTVLPGGEFGSVYSAQMQASGEALPVSWSILNGALPSGLTLNSSTGLISGQLLSPGAFTFTVQVRDALQQTASRPFTIEVSLAAEPLRINSRSLATATVGVAYQEQISASGGQPGYSFSLVGGSLAPGLSLTSSGAIVGTATTTGPPYSFTVRVSDRAGASADGGFSLQVVPGAFRLGCPSAPAEVGASYQGSALASGGVGPYSFSVSRGSLPGGLELDGQSGAVSGRPAAAGLFTFTLAASDSRNLQTQTLCSINVASGLLRLTTDDPQRGTAGVAFSAALEAAGGQFPYSFSISGGGLPPGLALSPGGAITGTPTKMGSFPVTAEVRDARGNSARKTFTFIIAASRLSLSCPGNLTPAYSFPYSDSFGTSNGLVPIVLTAIMGSLPDGLLLSAVNASGAATLTGTPTLPGDSTVTVRAVDSSDTAVTVSCRFRVSGQLLQITTDSLGQGQQFSGYSEGLGAQGGVGAYRWGVIGGGLPDGLQLDSSSGSISGRPLLAGTFGFTAQVNDSRGNRASRGFTIEITPGNLPLIITTGSPLADATVAVPYSAGFSVQGGKAPYSVSINGLPDWLSAGGGSVSGTPPAAGSAEFTVSASDANGMTTSKSFSLRIKGPGSLRIVSANVPDGVEGANYSGGFAAEGGMAPLLWSIVSGSLPAGVSFDSGSGRLSGRATSSGPFSLAVEVADSRNDTARAGADFAIRPAGVGPLQITTGTLPDASIGVAYSVNFGASGGQEPYSWSVNGDLLEGLSFNSNGALSGSVQRTGSASFVVTASDALGFQASRSFSLRAVAGAAPALLIEGLPDSITPNQTLPFTVRLASPFSVAVRGRLNLVFVPDAIHGADDSSVRFGNGARVIEFTIAPNSTQVVIPAAALTVASGTLAGTIRVDSSLEFAGLTAAGPSRSVTLARRAPVISSVRLTRSGSSIELRIEGFTSSRRLTEARVTFTAAAGVDLTTNSQVTVNVQAAIQAWFANAAAGQFGGQFALVLPFTVSGDAANISSVSVVIVNEDGSSNTVTAN